MHHCHGCDTVRTSYGPLGRTLQTLQACRDYSDYRLRNGSQSEFCGRHLQEIVDHGL